MKAVIQRVSSASVTIDNSVHGAINLGYTILLGIGQNDTQEDIDWLANKVVNLRIFGDDEGKMNNNIMDVNGDILVISQFTLHAKTKKGNRPSFVHAAHPDIAIPLYQSFIDTLESLMGKKVACGQFGAYMQVELINDGPVTIIIDTKNKE